MLKRIVFATGLLVAAQVSPAFAQSPRVEISGFAGWTFSDGVSGNTVLVPGVGSFDRVDPKDSGSFGFSVGVLATPNLEVGFIYDYQPSKVVFSGSAEREFGDLAINGYHGYVGYNFGDPDAKVRPYAYGGLGATNYGSSTGLVNGVTRTTSGGTQFSSTWGAGAKFFLAPHVGLRVGASFTPTYIKTDPGGYWCDPFWGCYTVGNAQYSNQFQFSGGVTVRF